MGIVTGTIQGWHFPEGLRFSIPWNKGVSPEKTWYSNYAKTINDKETANGYGFLIRKEKHYGSDSERCLNFGQIDNRDGSWHILTEKYENEEHAIRNSMIIVMFLSDHGLQYLIDNYSDNVC